MRTANVVVVIGIAGISAMFATASHGQMDVPGSSNAPKAETVDDAAGNLHVPDAYRTTYQSLGSWAVGADQGQGSKELHIVYASPGTIATYRGDGHFPDGAVLVKEVHQAATEPMTTGTVSHADTLKGWFVMVKDSNGRHAGNKLWGDGWGWSWFDAANPSKTTSTDYLADCKSCHVPAQATDWVYVGGYPPLKR
jgi:Cytochrome P460